MKKLHIDIETYSDANLPKTGAQFYARHPSTRVMLFAYSYGQDVKLVDLERGESIPEQVIADMHDPAVIKFAHNAAFERACLSNVLGIKCDPEQWRCTMVWAMSLSLPGSLEKLSTVLKLSSDEAKMSEGKRLIGKFCLPGADPQSEIYGDDWNLFRKYCINDVRAEMGVARRLANYSMPEHEWQAWATDQRVNDNGLPIDSELVARILTVAQEHKEETLNLSTQLTGLDNPNSRTQLIQWLSSHGVDVDDLQAGTVAQLLKGKLPDVVRDVLEQRQQLSKASLAKFDALKRATCDDERLRGAFQFAGAGRTGRFAGRIFQPQNLPRPTLGESDIDEARTLVRHCDTETMAMLYDDLSGVLSSLIRSVIAAPKGKKLVVADYASIESIMVAWCAQSDYLIKLFQDGLDPYKDFATKIYNIKYDDVTKQQRSFAKPAVLGCGYGLGAKGLQNYAAVFGMQMSMKEAKKQVDTFRESYADIPKFWSELETAVSQSMASKGKKVQAGRFTFQFDGKFLILGLPSNRNLYYYQPKMDMGGFGRMELTYMGREPGSRIGTHPGKIVENVVQAVARDLLIEGLKNTEKAGFEIVGHVHDEIICLVDEDDESAEQRLIEAMTRTPAWCKDAPVRADGYCAPYYRKD